MKRYRFYNAAKLEFWQVLWPDQLGLMLTFYRAGADRLKENRTASRMLGGIILTKDLRSE